MNNIKKLDEWLCRQLQSDVVPNEEKIVYSKVLDYIERNIYLEDYDCGA